RGAELVLHSQRDRAARRGKPRNLGNIANEKRVARARTQDIGGNPVEVNAVGSDGETKVPSCYPDVITYLWAGRADVVDDQGSRSRIHALQGRDAGIEIAQRDENRVVVICPDEVAGS